MQAVSDVTARTRAVPVESIPTFCGGASTSDDAADEAADEAASEGAKEVVRVTAGAAAPLPATAGTVAP